jgi:hypothetical protein
LSAEDVIYLLASVGRNDILHDIKCTLFTHILYSVLKGLNLFSSLKCLFEIIPVVNRPAGARTLGEVGIRAHWKGDAIRSRDPRLCFFVLS